MTLRRIAVAVLAVLVACTPARAVDLQRDETSGLEYLEVLTAGADADAKLPVVVAIHGLGDDPESFRLLLDDLPAPARLLVPRAPKPHGANGFSWFEFHTPDDEAGTQQLAAGVGAAAERLAKFLVAMQRKHQGPARAVACGFSQGGMLSFALAAAHPELVASAVPVAGYLPPPLWPAERPTFRPLPKILALHGEADPLIPLQQAKWTVEALRSNGFPVELRSWPGVRHALPPEIRSALMSAVVKAVEELAPEGTVLQGPPSPVRAAPDGGAVAPDAPRLEPAPFVDAPFEAAPAQPPAGDDGSTPAESEPSPLDAPVED